MKTIPTAILAAALIPLLGGGVIATAQDDAPAPNNTSRTHVVMPGETHSEIARQHDVSVAGLMKSNHLKDGNRLRVGQMLVIPRKP
ncbi:MAG: LysM domain-containing protein [Kiritimatiellaeota bacterium]|nr:LysM domain-containing protein [Kiritimatiellota bacterium]